MTIITAIEQETTDFDWYFTDGINIGRACSCGGMLPSKVAQSRENIEILEVFFRNLEPISDFTINPQLKEILGVKIVTDIYLGEFIFMTERGIFTFDKTKTNNFIDTRYHCVAKPTRPISFTDLPQNISDIILNSKPISPDRNQLDSSLFDIFGT